MSNWIPITVVSAYMVVLFGMTAWAQRLNRRGGEGLVSYLLAGRGLPSWVAAALVAGLAVGGASTIGVAERAYTVGISAGWYNAAWSFGALVLGLVAARRFRRMELTTLPEFFERHYTSTARVLAVAGQLAIQVVITSLQYVAGGAILRSLLPEVFSDFGGMLTTAVVFVAITLIGGFWAAGLTNVVNVIVIYVGIVLGAVLTLQRVGGFEGLQQHLPAAHPGFDLWAVGPGLIAAWFLIMVTTTHSNQATIQIGFATRDEKSSRNAYLLGALLILPVGFISALIGMAAAGLYPDILPKEALPRVVLELPPVAAGLILAGLWAADVSTASALLMGSATVVSTDVIKRFFVRDLSPHREQLMCRLTVAGLSVFTFVLALGVSQNILGALLAGLSLGTAYALIVLMTLFAPRLCRRGSGTWTLAATMVSFGLWYIMPAAWHLVPHPIYFTWVVSLLAFFVVMLVDKRPMLGADAAR
ncbi:MAG: sodium:solute symporter family protein [Pseudomonadota bacterium]